MTVKGNDPLKQIVTQKLLLVHIDINNWEVMKVSP